MSTYKDLALAILFEEEGDMELDDAIKQIAQEVLDLHNDKNEEEFNSTLMPPEEVLPNESESYEKIEKVINLALEKNEGQIENL